MTFGGNMNVGNKPNLQRSQSLSNIGVDKKATDEPKSKRVRSQSLKNSPKLQDIVKNRQDGKIPPRRNSMSDVKPKVVSQGDDKSVDKRKTISSPVNTPPKVVRENVGDENENIPDLGDENRLENQQINNQNDNLVDNVDNLPIVDQGNNQPIVNENVNLPPVNPNAVLLIQQNIQENPPPGHVRINVPGLSQPVNLNLQMVPEGLRNSPTIQTDLQAKIERGSQMFRNVSSGNIPEFMKPTYNGELTLEQKKEKAKAISDLAFYIQAQGEAKVGAFKQGAFSLPDPNGNVLKFLTSYPHSYPRMSSHVNDIQNSNVSNDRMNPGTEHYGLDLHDDGAHLDTALPNGSGTILFGKLPAASLTTEQNPVYGDRLFFKMEDHGTGGGGTDNALRNPPGQAGGKLQKIKDFFGHAKGYIKSAFRRLFGNNNPEGTFKERIPGTVKNDYKALMNACKGNRQIHDILKSGHHSNDSKGFRVMMANIDKVEAEHALDLRNNPDLREAIDAFKDKYRDNPEFDHPTLRFGQEVILTDQELRGEQMREQQALAPLPAVTRNQLAQFSDETCKQFILGSDGNPDSEMVTGGNMANPEQVANERQMSASFAKDFVRDGYILDSGEEEINGRDYIAEGGKLSEAGYDKVRDFFVSQYPNDPNPPEMGLRAMRVVTSACNQNVFNPMSNLVMLEDPNSALHLKEGLVLYPLTPLFSNRSVNVSPNSDGTFTIKVTAQKKPADEIASGNRFALGGTSPDTMLYLDPEKSDFRFEYELKVDPREVNLNSDAPRVTVTSMTAYEKLYDTSGNLIFKRP